MAQANETNNSVYTETKSLSEIQSAQEFIHLNSDQTQGFQHSVIKEEIDPDHPTNLNSVESHIPSQGSLYSKYCDHLFIFLFPKSSCLSRHC